MQLDDLFGEGMEIQFNVGDLVTARKYPGSQGLIVQRDTSNIFFKVEWLTKEKNDEEEQGDEPVTTVQLRPELHLIARAQEC